MFKLIKFDISLLTKNKIFFIYLLISHLSLIIYIPLWIVKTSNLNNIIITNYYIPFIFLINSFLIFAAPLSRHSTSKIGGNYSKLIFSLPISKKQIVNEKFLFLLFYTLSLIIIESIIIILTLLILKEPLNLISHNYFFHQTVTTVIIYGGIYLLLFFVTKHHNILSLIIYLLSLLNFTFLINNFIRLILWYNKIIVILLLLFIAFSYIISMIRFNYRPL